MLDCQKGRLKEDNPFGTNSVINHRWMIEWLAGWLGEHADEKMDEYTVKIDSLSEQQKDDLTEYLDEAVHDLHDHKTSRYNPYDPDSEIEAYEAFINEQSAEASVVNNQGYEAQIRHLLVHSLDPKIDDIFSKL